MLRTHHSVYEHVFHGLKEFILFKRKGTDTVEFGSVPIQSKNRPVSQILIPMKPAYEGEKRVWINEVNAYR